MKTAVSKYGKVIITIHWVSAFLILLLIPIGLFMTRAAEGASQASLYRIHVVIGVLVVLLTLVRIAFFFIEARPPAPQKGMSPWRLWVFHGIHLFTYLFILLLGFSGVNMLLSSGFGFSIGNIDPAAIARDLTPLKVHGIVSKLFIALLIAHIGGALEYHYTTEAALPRMGVNWLKGK